MVYDYKDAVRTDVEEWIKDYVIGNGEYNFTNKDELWQQLYDDMFCEDSITGNASGSYTCNRAKSAEYIAGNEDLIVSAIEDFGDEPSSYKKALIEPEYADVIIRCYLLAECLTDVLDDMIKSGEIVIKDDEDEDE